MPRSFHLEEPIPVNYTVVASPWWVANRVEPGAIPEDRLALVHRPQDVYAVLDWLEAQSVLGLDTESSGFKERDGLDPVSSTSRLVLMQVGTADRVFLFEPDLIEKHPRIKLFLQDTKRLFLLQNAVHDFKWFLHKYGIHLTRYYCTMLAEQVMTAGKEGTRVSLLDLARKYPPHYIITKEVRKNFVAFKKLTRSMIYYAARDIVLLFPVFKGQLKTIEKYGLQIPLKDEFAALPATAEMELEGIPFDPVRNRQTTEYNRAAQTAGRKKIFEVYNRRLKEGNHTSGGLLGNQWKTFDINSNVEKLRALREVGVEIDNVQRDTLVLLDDELAQLLAEDTRYEKILSTYGDNLIARIHSDTGRVHPHFHQHGVGDAEAMIGDDGWNRTASIATARYSGDFQQMPKPKNIYVPVTDPFELSIVRKMFQEKLAA
jgi:hypothetical protein